MESTVTDRVDDEEVEDYLRGHERYVADNVADWNMWHHAYRTEFWKRPNMWTGVIPGLREGLTRPDLDPFAVKVEVNQVWPFIQTHLAALFFRAPRTNVALPDVWEDRAGRPAENRGAVDRVRAFNNEWMKQSDVQAVSTLVEQGALFHGAAAYRLGVDPKAKAIMSRVWIERIRRWDLMLDEMAESYRQQTYVGHLRWERFDRAKAIVGEGGEPWPERVELQEIPDVVADEGTRSISDRRRPRKYVRLLEFYDLIAGEQRFYLVDGLSSSVSCKRVGPTKPIPWELPSGRHGVPIIPAVMSNEPDSPFKGIPAVRRCYQLNAEANLILTIVANKLRRDAASITVVPEGIPPKLAQAIREARDGTVVEVPPNMQLGVVGALWKHLDNPVFAATIDKFSVMLTETRKDAQGYSDLMAGKQLQYASATEADIVATSGEMTIGETSARMLESMARAVELADVMYGNELDKPVRVRTIEGTKRLEKEELLEPWTVEIIDAGTTPMREKQRKADLAAVGATMIELVKIASYKPDPALPADPAAPTPEVVRMAQLQIDANVSAYDLPQTWTWQALSQTPQPAKAGLTPEEIARADELIGRMAPQPQPGGQLPPEVP